MKIIHILNHVEDCGNGIVCATIDLTCEQSKMGHDVYVLSAGGGFIPLLNSHGVQHIVLNQKRTPLNIIKSFYQLNAILKEINPNIVHAQMITAVILSWPLKFFYKFKLISTIHNEFQKSIPLMGLADKVIAVSEGVKSSMIKRGISQNKLQVVLNGAIGSVREELENDVISICELKNPAITIVAGLYKRKGIACLIEAFKIVKNSNLKAHLYIVGEGPDRKYFEDLSKNVDDIYFEGFQRNPKKYMQETDIFVLPSFTETFGLSLAEARESGCAVIGSNVGGIPEVLEQGKAGQLFEANNHVQLADLMMNLLNDEGEMLFWKEKAGKNLEWLSAKRVCADTLEVYQNNLRNKGDAEHAE